MMLVVAFLGVGGGFFTYGLILLLLQLVPLLSLVAAFFLFYGSIAELVAFLAQLVYSLVVDERPLPTEHATSPALTIPACLGIAAAAFGAINHPRVSSTFRWSRQLSGRSMESDNEPVD